MNILALYEQLTLAIGDETGASDSLLHVHAGMIVLLAARVITKRSLATWVPFSFVLFAALANELLDRINHAAWHWPDAGLDILNTVFWPMVLMFGLRIRRATSVERRKSS